MSVKQGYIAWEHSPYTSYMLLFHTAMADESNSDGVFKLTHATMATKMRCSVSSIKRYINQMKKDELLEVVEQGGQNRWNCSTYRLVWPEGFFESQYYGYQSDSRQSTDDPPKDLGQFKCEPPKQDFRQSTGELHYLFDKEQDKEQEGSSTCVSVTSAGNSKSPMSVAEILAARKASGPTKKVKKSKPAPAPPSEDTLQAQQLLRDRWDEEKNKTGKDPLWSFPGVMQIIKTYLQGGHTAEDINYLLENSPVYTKNAFQLCMSQKGNQSLSGRAQVNEAMNALDSWAAKKKLEDSLMVGSNDAIIEVDEAIQGELT